MEKNRRDAWRLSHDGVCWLAAKGFRAACTLEDISVSGARVLISSVRLSRPRALPEKLTLTAMVGGEQVTVPGHVTRTDRDADGLHLGIHFFNGDAANLGWLINQAQREDIRAAHGEQQLDGADLVDHPRIA